jgi:hypothetical protein
VKKKVIDKAAGRWQLRAIGKLRCYRRFSGSSSRGPSLEGFKATSLATEPFDTRPQELGRLRRAMVEKSLSRFEVSPERDVSATK